MKISEWTIPWFKSLNFNDKMMVAVNASSVITIIIMLFKRDLFLAKIQVVILINLIFWFLMAPDTRFTYGFLFVGFSLIFSYLLKLLESSSYARIFKYVKIGIVFFVSHFMQKNKVPCRNTYKPVNIDYSSSIWNS
jgi:hypothetical protein